MSTFNFTAGVNNSGLRTGFSTVDIAAPYGTLVGSPLTEFRVPIVEVYFDSSNNSFNVTVGNGVSPETLAEFGFYGVELFINFNSVNTLLVWRSGFADNTRNPLGLGQSAETELGAGYVRNSWLNGGSPLTVGGTYAAIVN